MLTYKIEPVRHKRTFCETLVFTDSETITANIVLNPITEKWTLGKERYEKGFLEMRSYGPAKVLVFRMPEIENPEKLQASQKEAWTSFLSNVKTGSYAKEDYMLLCEIGFPHDVTDMDINNAFRSLSMDRNFVDAERRAEADQAFQTIKDKGESTGFIDSKEKEILAQCLKRCGCFHEKSDELRKFYSDMAKNWVHVSLPEYPKLKHLFWNDGIYEIKRFYKRPHIREFANDKNFNEDLSWTVSSGLRKLDWVSAEVCWRLCCRNIVDSDEGKELLLRAFEIKDERTAYFNSLKAVKEIQSELLAMKPDDYIEIYGDKANRLYDFLLSQKVILNNIREIICEDTEGSIVFAKYDPDSASLNYHKINHDEMPDNLTTLTSALDIHKRTIKKCWKRLSESPVYIATKKKGVFANE